MIAAEPRAVIVDLPVIVAAVNEWPDGPSASLLRSCVDGRRIVLVLSERVLFGLHYLLDSGFVRAEATASFETLLGLLQSPGISIWHDDVDDDRGLPWPEYLNSLAILERAVAIVTDDDAVAVRASATPPFRPSDLPASLLGP